MPVALSVMTEPSELAKCLWHACISLFARSSLNLEKQADSMRPQSHILPLPFTGETAYLGRQPLNPTYRH